MRIIPARTLAPPQRSRHQPVATSYYAQQSARWADSQWPPSRARRTKRWRPAAKRLRRVAVIGAGHYHAFSPPNYLRILQSQNLNILGVHDTDAAIAGRYASQVAAMPYTDYRSIIEETKPEFVEALGRHAAMPSQFRFLVETGIPFLMEKPWGIDDNTYRMAGEV